MLMRHRHPDRVIFWNNYRLIRADEWRAAFRRATAHGMSDGDVGNRAFSHNQEFVGITDLTPIYEEFEDGAEVLWQEFDSSDCDSSGLPCNVFTEVDMEAVYDTQPPPPEVGGEGASPN